MILHETASKLANVFSRYCRDATGAAEEAETIVQELYDSLGGCEICFGRGYTALEHKLCECKRGQSLKEFIRLYDNN